MKDEKINISILISDLSTVFFNGALEQKIIFFKCSKRVQSRWAQNGPKWSKTPRLTFDVDKPAMFGHYWSKMYHFWAIPSHERSTPKWKKGSSPRLLWVACLWNPKSSRLEHKYGRNIWKMSKIGQKSMKKWLFFASILPWMARYGSEISLLLIFSARDDLVKVSWKSDAQKCQNQLREVVT